MKTKDELYELDKYELLEEFKRSFNLQITEDSIYNPDLRIGAWQTADGYDINVISQGDYAEDIDFENDVYYYPPSTAVILDRIIELGSGITVCCDDIDLYFEDEEAIIDELIKHFPDKYIDDDENKDNEWVD